MGESYITCHEANGSINISEEVISTLVRETVTQIEGVAGLSNTSGAELVELIGIKTLSKGVKVQFVEEKIVVDAIITISYGYNIMDVAKTVQDEVMSIVLSATGMDKAEINVHVSGVAFDK